MQADKATRRTHDKHGFDMVPAIAQFAAGLWEFRTGNTFGATAFCSYGAFWISFYILLHIGVDSLPKTEIFSAVGLYLWAWGIFTAYMFIASLRTTGAVASPHCPALRCAGRQTAEWRRAAAGPVVAQADPSGAPACRAGPPVGAKSN